MNTAINTAMNGDATLSSTFMDRSLRALPLPSAATLDFTLRVPRWLPGAGLALLLTSLLILALQWRQPMLGRLQIEGAFDRVAPESVRQAAATYLTGSFFKIDVDAIRGDVVALPWVERARVERVWPNGVRIRTWERQAFARWNDDALLDTSAIAFRPEAHDLLDARVTSLPRLSGTPGNEKLVSETFKTLSAALIQTPLELSSLKLDARGEWTAQTRRGIELRLGPGTAAAKLPVLQGALLAALGDRLAEVAYVDLRYTNGFAIGWLGRAASNPQVHEATPAPVAGTGSKDG